MLTAEENELLCRIEGDAPMGQLIRRHWFPACLSEEIAEADGTPVNVRLLGENLVAWRDTEGRVGLMDRFCAHRQASLALGRNEDNGLRCLYHGWKYDVTGKLVEAPSEPDDSCPKISLKSYPTHEHGGIVWTYMGPRDTMPSFEPPAFAPTSQTKVSIVKIIVQANWAQVTEGALDSSHSSNLHSSDITPARVGEARATRHQFLRPSTDKAPRIQTEQTSFGLKYAALRRPIVNSSTHDYVRMTVFVAPFTVLIPPNNLYNLANVNVPVDDTHTVFYFFAWSETEHGAPNQEEWRQFCGAQVGIDLDTGFNNKHALHNNFLQDRSAMKLGNFTGIRGIPQQDIAMWESMEPIADRSRDRLGASDQAVVAFRRLMVDAAKTFKDGGPAIGTRTSNDADYLPQAELRSFEGVVPKETEWRDLVTASAQKQRLAASSPGDKQSVPQTDSSYSSANNARGG